MRKRNWRKALKWTMYTVLGMALVGVGAYYVKTAILPYSLKYNQNGRLSTTPNGVADNGEATNSTMASVPVARAVLLVPVTSSALASDGFDQPIQLKVSLIDTNGKAIAKGADATVTLSSSSPSGQFDVGTAVTLDSETPTAVVKYHDTAAGGAKLSAFVSGLVGSTANVTIMAAAPATITPITPLIKSPALSQQQLYTVTLQDRFGNTTTGGTVNWSVVSDEPALPYSFGTAVPADSLGVSRFNLVLPSNRAGIADILSATFGSHNVNLRIVPTSR